jgi:glyceraldehyde-3-phosphate dehydrogenase/erythrose-4-phosphate dehydrogenase
MLIGETEGGGELSGILNYCDEPLVSSDFRGNPASSIVDGSLHGSDGRENGEGFVMVRQ